jgi:hypothetical protein
MAIREFALWDSILRAVRLFHATLRLSLRASGGQFCDDDDNSKHAFQPKFKFAGKIFENSLVFYLFISERQRKGECRFERWSARPLRGQSRANNVDSLK